MCAKIAISKAASEIAWILREAGEHEAGVLYLQYLADARLEDKDAHLRCFAAFDAGLIELVEAGMVEPGRKTYELIESVYQPAVTAIDRLYALWE